MSTRAIMIQGTGSNVGKSVIVAGLCRVAKRRGLSVAPFKAQNMSNNAAVCADGGEIGRAQALQARACGISPSVHHNPVLIKPESDCGARLIVRGQVAGQLQASAYRERREHLLQAVLGSFAELATRHELIIVEGAGSPAEVNLRAGDIANMGFATAAQVPVVMLADIDRGGVIASLVGTQAVLAADDAAMIRAFLINRFRGDRALFDDGLTFIRERTGWASLGVIPWLDCVARLPAEDAMDLQSPPAVPGLAAAPGLEPLRIAVPLTSRIANVDDLDPLRAEPNVSVEWVAPGRALPAQTDVVLLLGTKSTLADMRMLHEQGWAEQIRLHAQRGGWVTGICGGLQMLGGRIVDEAGVDGDPGGIEGLGLLPFVTRMAKEKQVRQAQGQCLRSGAPVTGYEIHSGVRVGQRSGDPLLRLNGVLEGERSGDGRVEGTYLHGMFHGDEFRRAWLETRRAGAGSALAFDASVEAALDELADALERHVDVRALFSLAQPVPEDVGQPVA
ncbi:MAG: cobyric acid synthase [Pseudomonadota bacterium]